MNRITTLQLLLALAGTSSLQAQTTLWHLDGPIGSTFGRSIANIGDVNGDGFVDIAIGVSGDSTGGAGAGRLSAYTSGGTHLWSIFGTITTAGFGTYDAMGSDVAGIGDINADGVPDLLVTLGGVGKVYAISGANGTTLRTYSGTTFGFGAGIAGTGDVNGDGIADYLIGDAEGDDLAGVDTGLVSMYSGATGSVLFTVYGDVGSSSGPFGITLPGDWFGGSIAAGEDLTGDGVPDFAVGAVNNDAGAPEAGQVKVFNGATGQLLSTHLGSNNGDRYGTDLALLGDIDGDGKSELAIGVPYSDASSTNAGAVEVIFSGGIPAYTSTGTILAGDEYGTSLAAAGDLNGDGIPDIIVGAPRAETSHEGAVHLIDGATGLTITRAIGLLADDQLGGDVAGGFDLDSDGFAEFAASAQDSDSGGVNSGYVEMYGLAQTSSGIAYCFGDGSGTSCPCGNPGAAGRGCANGSAIQGAKLTSLGNSTVGSDSIILRVDDTVPGQPGLFFQGNNAIAGGAGLMFGDGLRCAGGSIIRLQVVAANASGQAASSVSVSVAGAVSAGDLKRYQWWYRDPVGTQCGAGFNLSNGFEISWN